MKPTVEIGQIEKALDELDYVSVHDSIIRRLADIEIVKIGTTVEDATLFMEQHADLFKAELIFAVYFQMGFTVPPDRSSASLKELISSFDILHSEIAQGQDAFVKAFMVVFCGVWATLCGIDRATALHMMNRQRIGELSSILS